VVRVFKLTLKARKHIVKELKEGMLASVLAEHYKISRNHVYRIARQDTISFKEVGRPKKQYTQQTKDLIVKLKKEKGWGVHKITFMLNRDYNTKLSHNAVYRILTERGAINKQPEKGKRYKYVRFERHHSNSMWQTDWKYLAEEERWLTAYLDDHSRFIVGASKFTKATTQNTLDLFHSSTKSFGYPREVLTDHGSQYWNKYGSRYQKELDKVGVEHILGRIKKPTTTGKIERFWLTYIQEHKNHNNLSDFIHYYNHERQHQSLEYKTPAEIYYKDLPVT